MQWLGPTCVERRLREIIELSPWDVATSLSHSARLHRTMSTRLRLASSGTRQVCVMADGSEMGPEGMFGSTQN